MKEVIDYLKQNSSSGRNKNNIALTKELLNLHRTEQANVVRNLKDILICLGIGMQDRTDLRNQAAFEFCEEILNIDKPIPYI